MNSTCSWPLCLKKINDGDGRRIETNNSMYVWLHSRLSVCEGRNETARESGDEYGWIDPLSALCFYS